MLVFSVASIQINTYMAIEIQFNTRVNVAVDLILNDEVNPILDFNDTRYSIDISRWHHGMIIWTPVSISLRTVIGEVSYTYPYAAHNIMRDAIASGQPSPVIDTTFPAFAVPPENGFVTP